VTYCQIIITRYRLYNNKTPLRHFRVKCFSGCCMYRLLGNRLNNPTSTPFHVLQILPINLGDVECGEHDVRFSITTDAINHSQKGLSGVPQQQNVSSMARVLFYSSHSIPNCLTVHGAQKVFSPLTIHLCLLSPANEVNLVSLRFV